MPISAMAGQVQPAAEREDEGGGGGRLEPLLAASVGPMWRLTNSL